MSTHSRRPAHFTIRFEGRSIPAREGDSVAAALVAAGVEVFGRSFKYHRPRGYHCGRGHCSSCAMRVNGLPGVRTCVTPARPGTSVEREHAWPNADHDLLRGLEAFSRLTPVGFYYRRFTRSPALFHRWERLLAALAGRGRIADRDAAAVLLAAPATRSVSADVLVVGGGPAGIAAAVTAAAGGAQTLLLESDDRLGGTLSCDPDLCEPPAFDVQDLLPEWRQSMPGPAAAHALASRASSEPALQVRTGNAVAGLWEDGVVFAEHESGSLLVHSPRIVFATGCIDDRLLFPGCDLPGVMLGHGVQRLLQRYGLRPGRTAVVVTDGHFGYALATQLHDAGVQVRALVDRHAHRAPRTGNAHGPAAARVGARAGGGSSDGFGLGGGCSGGDGGRTMTAPVFAGYRVAEAHGTHRVEGIRIVPGAAGTIRGSRDTISIDCDTVCIAVGGHSHDDLFAAARAHSRRAPAHSDASEREPIHGATSLGLIAKGVEGWAAGGAAGAGSLDEALRNGRQAGLAAAERSGRQPCP